MLVFKEIIRLLPLMACVSMYCAAAQSQSNNTSAAIPPVLHLLLDDGPSSQLVAFPRGLLSHGGKRKALDQAIIDNPSVSGFLVLDGWQDIETQEGVFDWSHIDSEVARAKSAGKVVRLAIHAGGDSAPAWIFDNYPVVKQVIWYNKQSGDIEWLPAYWDPTYLEIKQRFYQAIGSRYKDEVSVFAISASMVDPNTGDWAFLAKTEEQTQSYIDAGFTEQVFIDAYKRLIDNAMAAFENKRVITAVGPLPTALVSDRYAALHTVLDYVFAAYDNRLIIAKGSLHAATPVPSELPAQNAWNTIDKYSPNVAAQFVWSVSADSEFKMNGGTAYEESAVGDIFLAAAQVGKEYNLRWIEPWSSDLLNPDLAAEIISVANLFQSD